MSKTKYNFIIKKLDSWDFCFSENTYSRQEILLYCLKLIYRTNVTKKEIELVISAMHKAFDEDHDREAFVEQQQEIDEMLEKLNLKGVK